MAFPTRVLVPRRALADEYDKRRLDSIRDAQLRAQASVEEARPSRVAEPSAAVCEASNTSMESTGLTNVFDFIAPTTSPTLCTTSPSYIIETQMISRPHHISPELWAAAAPRQKETEHNLSKYPSLHYIPKSMEGNLKCLTVPQLQHKDCQILRAQQDVR